MPAVLSLIPMDSLPARDWTSVAMRVLGSAVLRIREWRASRRLYALDDHMLKDIGVSRGNIDWIAHIGRRNGES